MSKIVDGILKDIKSVPEKAKAKLKGGDTKKLLLQNFPYFLFAYVFNKVAWLYRINTKEAALDKVFDMMNSIDKAFANPLPSFHLQDVLIGVAGGIAFKLIVYMARFGQGNNRHKTFKDPYTRRAKILQVNLWHSLINMRSLRN